MALVKFSNYYCVLMIFLGLTGCRTLDRLAEINEKPPISHIINPVAHPNYRPVTMPMPAAQPVEVANNSLWKAGAKTFFKDQRAKRVGDILTVNIDINDKASISNQTKTSKHSSQSIAVNNFMGIENSFSQVLPESVNPANLVGLTSKPTLDGSGSVNRSEQITFTLAATIIQELANGNLVISGRQEMRVNNDVRELVVAGIVRPSDITAANTIAYAKISEARMSYGSRGQIDDMQTAPWGHQVINALSPF